MKTFIAILRGINVGGSNKIKMADLRDRLQSLNFLNIETYIQSGNIIFDYESESQNQISHLIQTFLKFEYDIQIPVFVKSISDLEAILSSNPFISEQNDKIHKLYVTMLSKIPEQATIKPLASIDFSPDQYFIDHNIVYLFCPNGYGRTKLTNAFWEKKLNVQATTRNWRSMNKILTIAKRHDN